MRIKNFKDMKRTLLLILTLFICALTTAQKNPRERVKAHKVAYITEQLNLSSKEAQQFWPIYNEHESTIDKLKKEERSRRRLVKESEGIETISDTKAGELLDGYLKTEEQKIRARQKLIRDLQAILPNKKILKLIKAEIDFNRSLLERFRQKRMNRKMN